MNLPDPKHARSLAWMIAWLLLVMAGCVTRDIHRDFPNRSQPPFSVRGQTKMPDHWWTAFDDPNLHLLVNQALGDNFDLAVALQRLRAARAVVQREASDLFPDIDGIIGTDSTFGPGPNRTNIEWGLDAAYQVDLWGQIQSRVEAEQFRAQATEADYHAVALSLSAEVSQTWFSLIEAHAQLKLLNEQVANNRRSLKIQQARFGVGVNRLADWRRQEQLVEETLEQAVVVQSRVEVLEHQLAVLLGQPPQEASFAAGVELPELPPMPDAGLPSELLTRRPDVQRDYLAFAAADRDLAAAISAQYPRINLTGSVINSADRAENLFRNWFVSIGSQLIAPLFDGGQRRAEVDRTAAVVRQRFHEYGQTMLIAFQEVEDNLARERYQIERIKRLTAQVAFAKEAYDLLLEQYLTGGDNFLDVLSATQSQQRLQRDALSARLDLILIRIRLYLALAGDFDTRPQALGDSGPNQGFRSDHPCFITNQLDLPANETKLPSTAIERLPPVESASENDFHE